MRIHVDFHDSNLQDSFDSKLIFRNLINSVGIYNSVLSITTYTGLVHTKDPLVFIRQYSHHNLNVLLTQPPLHFSVCCSECKTKYNIYVSVICFVLLVILLN